MAIRVLEFLRLLERPVDLLVFGDEDRQQALAAPATGRLIQVQRPPRQARSPLSQSLFGDPTTLVSFRSERYADRMRECLAEGPALVLAVGLQMGQYLDAVPATIPTILDDYNVEWKILDRLAGLKGGLKRHYWRHEARKLRNWESRLLQKPRTVLAISEVDRSGLRELAPRQDIRVVGPCIPAEADAADEAAPVEPVLVFTGAFNWHVNVQAAEWFCRSVLPQVQARVPEARVELVGKDPAPEVRALAQLPGVAITGTVPDVLPYLRKASAAIVPLKYGSGVRYKILEAFSAGAPVVTTSVGCEGLDVRHGRELLIADDAAAFAAACCELLESADARKSLARQGTQWLQEINRATAASFRGVVRECLNSDAVLTV